MRRTLSLFLILVLCESSSPQQTLDKFAVKHLQASQNPHISKYAYVLAGAIWQKTNVYVCWENPSNQAASDMRLVEQAVTETWQASSKLQFTGWSACGEKNEGIRILIDDSGPRTLALGKQISGVKGGMLLNFKFAQWSPACQSMHRYCVYAIAVHEFGHAIGFSHEQNRADAPGECQRLRQGSDGDKLLTPYDEKSVMNYCNAKWNNDGQLSALDASAVQELYGSR